MGHLLEMHLLEKSARQQNLDCSTPVEQIEKKMNLLKSDKFGHFRKINFSLQKRDI